MSESKFKYVGGDGGPKKDAVLDVVFVHGLTGDATETWTSASGYWPEWLSEDHPDINVYSVGYSSAVWKDFIKGNEASLRDRATTVAQYLATRKSRGRPILFVTHSLGGLIVKKLLRLCHDTPNPSLGRVASECRAVAFIATPHGGSNIATALNAVLSIATNETTKELKKNSEELIDLSSWFSGWSPQKNVTVLAFYETQKHKTLIIVDKVSANPNVNKCVPIAIDLDHVSISKVDSRESLIYVSISQLIEDLVSSGGAGGPGDGSADDLQAEFKALSEEAPEDRRSLAEKLEAGARTHEISTGESRKEEFNKALRRNITSPSAVARYARLMGAVKVRFDRHVGLAIASGKTVEEVDAVIQASVIDGTLISQQALGEETSPMQVEGAMYYLGGNCHVKWD